MFSSSLRRAAARTVLRGFHLKLATPTTIRAFSVHGARKSSEGSEVSKGLFGPGAKPGTVPTDYEQATGLERAELLAKLEGKELFDLNSLPMSHLGTKKEPVFVKSLYNTKIIGCTGFPTDSHEPLWLVIDRDHELDRCPECGCVFKMDYVGSPETEAHHH
ncbi:3398_t:CDS:2 [Ambispora gerdemannii]|uniref:3398_t:CDS:1 n=1 Tax=Ambispora gerdemannii TaxID=144530 RepID=A0A9N8VFC1_9GLOM|nr:3398_t:CDS:2 [Ambispora gerdemannii]